MRDIGVIYAELEKQGIGMPVVNINIDYLLPAPYDEEITIETWIDTGNTVVLELLRTVPTDGHYIIIIDALKNSQTKEHKYFIPYADFCKRYTLIDGTSITEDMTSQFETTTMVQAIGIITGFAAIEEDTYTGDYEKPASWGKGIAGGADQEGYWMASIEKPTEWYFMPYTHFERDYEIL